MMTAYNIPNQLLDEISDAIAIITNQYILLYANDAFKKIFTIPRHNQRKMPIREFEELNLQQQNHQEPFMNKHLFSPGLGRNCEVCVYLLNKLKNEQRCYLLLIKLANNEKDFATRESEALTNSFIDEKEIYSEKLSRHFERLVGNDLRFRKVLMIAQRAATSDLPVLIFGESGTGKEILVRAIHQTSHRCNKPLVDVNCAAIPDTLIESEIFGYEKGSFTGARPDGRQGYFDEANEGTIFLDEIGDASLQTQSKLLRVLEDGCFKRVGGNRNIEVDVRIISATNKNLQNMITEHTFRDDLFYRLNTFAIYLPPLRERQGDIPLLVDYFLKNLIGREKRNIKISSETMKFIQAYPWPGNIRELKGVVSYAVNMAHDSVISPDSLPNFLLIHEKKYHKKFGGTLPAMNLPATRCGEYNPKRFNPGDTLDLTTVVQQVERDLIRAVLTKSANRTEAIRALGISRRTFYMKIKQYGLA